MVNKNNIKTIKAIIFIAVLAAAIAAVFGVKFNATNYAAYADEPTVRAKELKGYYFIGLNGVSANIAEREYTDEKYPRKVVARFEITAPYYFIETNGETEQSKVEITPENQIVEYEANESGNYEVKVIGCSDEKGTKLDHTIVYFSVDADKPTIADGEKVVEPMTEWLREGKKYVAVANWSAFRDDRSGVSKICYYFEYPNGSRGEVTVLDYDVSPDRTVFEITEKCTLVAVCYDNAGNGLEVRYGFDRFDFYAPPAPTYEITPEPREGFYASEYKVKVTFLPDNGGSGLQQTQYYTIYENGQAVTKPFEQASTEVCAISLATACDHKIILYATDNAGNVSETKSLSVPFSAFDVTEPTIKDKPTLIVDVLDANAFFTVSVYATDKKESGISKATFFYGDKSYEMKPDQTVSGGYARYGVVLPYDAFNAKVKEFIIEMEDAAGNRAERVDSIPYFSDSETATLINRVMKTLDGFTKTDYTDAAAKSVERDAATLNRLLSYPGNSKSDIIKTAQSLMTSIESDVTCSTIIESVPDYASGIISFSAFETDFTEFKKGTQVTLTLMKGKNDGKDYPSIAKAGKAFTDFFGLKITIDGKELVEPLKKGLSVKMNMPNKYLDRTVALVNVKTGEVVPTETINNAIRFTLKQSTDYALVIYGSREPTATMQEASKKVTVFGKEMPLSRFLWIVCGCGGAAVVLVAALIILKKRTR